MRSTGDMRDPDLRFDEGWTTLFDGESLGKFVVVLSNEEGGKTGGKWKKYFEDTAGRRSTFYVEDGMLKTAGNLNGYIRTSDAYDRPRCRCTSPMSGASSPFRARTSKAVR